MNTIKKETTKKIIIERSKFLSYIFCCENIEKQNKILKEVKKQNLSATHVCYASIFDDDGVKSYCSDDGEPSGTAGLQIQNALKENELINVLCVVVRYFGGVKLGIPGLGKAYKQSAISLIENNIKPVVLKDLYAGSCEYYTYNKVKNYLQKNNIELFNITFENGATFEVYLSSEEIKLLSNQNLNLVKKSEKKYC